MMIQDLSDSKIILIAWDKNVASGISSKRNSMNGCLKSMKKGRWCGFDFFTSKLIKPSHSLMKPPGRLGKI